MPSASLRSSHGRDRGGWDDGLLPAPIMPAPPYRTFGSLILEARTILQDKMPTSGGVLRYSDDEMFEAINGAIAEIRNVRPDLFIRVFGNKSLRTILPYYAAAHDMNTPFPLDYSTYNAVVYYVAGRCELREDSFSEDSRAVTLMNKFKNQLLTVQS